MFLMKVTYFFFNVVGFCHFSESILVGIGFPFAETVIRSFSFVPGGCVLSTVDAGHCAGH